MRLRLLVFAVMILSVGCAGELENPDDFTTGPTTTAGDGDGDGDGDGACDAPALMMDRCTGAGCHSAGAPAAQLDLESGDIAGRLLDAPGSEFCGSVLLIDSANPAASLLLDKLGAAPSCGLQMPLGGALEAADVQCIEQFVDDAAAAALVGWPAR